VAKTIGNDKGALTRARRVTERDASALNDQPTAESGDEEMDTPLEDEATFEDEQGTALPASGGNIVERHAAPITRRRTVPEPLMGNPITRFIVESYIELRKVTWPTMNEAWNMTLIVIIMSAVIAAILGLADLGLVQALSWLVGH